MNACIHIEGLNINCSALLKTSAQLDLKLTITELILGSSVLKFIHCFLGVVRA